MLTELTSNDDITTHTMALEIDFGSKFGRHSKLCHRSIFQRAKKKSTLCAGVMEVVRVSVALRR